MRNVPAPSRLSELLAGLAHVPRTQDREVTGLSADSRTVRAGELFLAVPGSRHDGRRFAADAVGRGASAVVAESAGDTQGGQECVVREVPAADTPWIEVPDLRRRLGEIADRFYGRPSERLFVVGVTGTNGKTTCAYLLAQAMSHGGRRHAVVGTLGSGFPGELERGVLTTPDAVSLHRRLAELERCGASGVCIEVSSHGLEQGRVGGVRFDAAVFTNLTHEHLDYHGSMDAYGRAKAALFRVPTLRYAVINGDDPFGAELATTTTAPTRWRYGMRNGDVRALSMHERVDGLGLRLATPAGELALNTKLLGRFNAYNAMAVVATLLASGRPGEVVVEAFAGLEPAPGRMERFVGRGDAPTVVIDYAHTPDALQKALEALRNATSGKLILVFGCGGDRDRGKRPLMGRIAERLAERVVLTDDNPRSEPSMDIIAEIRAGMSSAPEVIADRREAISWAIRQGGRDDVVLVAGKGHEETQEIAGRLLPFSDRSVVADLLGAAA